MTHPIYSSDIALCNYYMIFFLKNSLRQKILLIINNCLNDIKKHPGKYFGANSKLVRKYYKIPGKVDDDLQNIIAQVYVYKISPFSKFAWVFLSQKTK